MKRNELAKDFRSLSQFLSDWGKKVKNPGILNNVNIISDASNHLNYGILESEPLTFINIDLDRHCIPQGIEKLKKDEAIIEIKLTSLHKEANHDNENIDPIHALGVNMAIDVTYSIKGDMKEATCSWHLDKGETGASAFSHPIYHMNFGGNHMNKQGDVFGKLLLMSAPRIIHPPLDIILSCDFIIRNFYKIETHTAITENPGYKELLERAKNRYWMPYFKAFASKWYAEVNVENLPYTSLVGH